MREWKADGSSAYSAPPAKPNEGVALGALFDAHRWLILGHGSRALAWGVACVEAGAAVPKTELDVTAGLASEKLRVLSPREPVLVVVDGSMGWIRLAELLATMKVHHGPMVLLFPESTTLAETPVLDGLHNLGGRLLEVQVGEDVRPAFVLRHARSALSGTTGEAELARSPWLDHPIVSTGVTAHGPMVDARLPLRFPSEARVVARVVEASSGLSPCRRPSPFVEFVPDATDSGGVEQQILDLLVQGLVPSLPAATIDRLPLAPDVLHALRSIQLDPATRWSAERDSVRLRRAAVREHTIAGRRARGRSVTVILVTRRPAFLSHALDQVLRQDHPRLELILVGHGIDPAVAVQAHHRSSAVALRTAVLPPEQTLGDGLRLATAMASGELILKMDDDDWYGPHLVSDLVAALEVSGAELVGSAMDFVYLSSLNLTIRRGAASERFGSHVSGATLLLGRDDLLALGGWPRVRRAVDSRLLDGLRVAGGAHYAMHGFGYLVHRHGDGNTFVADDAWFLRGCSEQWPGLDLTAADICDAEEQS